MGVSISEFVDINLSVAGATLEKFSFGALLGVFEHTVTADRQNGPYTSQVEGVEAGFTAAAAPEIYAWLGRVFSQENGVASAMVGRKIAAGGDPVGYAVSMDASGPTATVLTTAANSATAADVTLFPATEDIGDWVAFGHQLPFELLTLDNAGGTAGVGGVVTWEYWDGSDWAAISGVTDGTTGFTATASDGQEVTFTAPIDWAATTVGLSPSLYFVRAIITTVYTTNPVYDQVFVGGDADYAAALTAIEADDPTTFYYVNSGSRVAADIADIADWCESRTGDNGLPKFYVSQSGDADFLNGVASNIGEILNDGLYTRTALLYYSDSAEYADGAWAGRCGGFNLDAPAGGNGGQGGWGFKQLAGITKDTITGPQATAIYAVQGNLYAQTKLAFTSKGTSASGRKISTTTSNDWFKVRLQEGLISLQVNQPTRIPYTNEGIALIRAEIESLLARGISYGHISADAGTVVATPDVSEVSAVDKANGDFTATVEYTLAGEITKIILQVNVQL